MAGKNSKSKGFLQAIKGFFAHSWPLLLICATVIGIHYYVLFRHYVSSYWTLSSDVVYRVESKILDLKFSIRGPQKPTGKVGILAVDEKTLTSFGTWPFPRKYYAKAWII